MARRIEIAFRWTRHPGGEVTGALRTVGTAVLRRLGVTQGEVGVLVCDDETIRTLNRHFRHKDSATDVLAFPAGAEQHDGPVYLGDIAISLDTAARQASECGHDLLRELETLLIHAILHLCGWDHEVDDGAMAVMESRLHKELLS